MTSTRNFQLGKLLKNERKWYFNDFSIRNVDASNYCTNVILQPGREVKSEGDPKSSLKSAENWI